VRLPFLFSFVRNGLAGFIRAVRRIRIFNFYGQLWASWAVVPPGPKAGGLWLRGSATECLPP
jgi:hypothetical protein